MSAVVRILFVTNLQMGKPGLILGCGWPPSFLRGGREEGYSGLWAPISPGGLPERSGESSGGWRFHPELEAQRLEEAP